MISLKTGLDSSDPPNLVAEYSDVMANLIMPNTSNLRVAAVLVVVLSGARLFAATYAAPPDQLNLRIPPVGTGGSGDTNQDVTRSTIVVSGFDTNRAVYDISISFSLNHTYDGDLIITLIPPDGSRMLLANRIGGAGHDFIKTSFSYYGLGRISNSSSPFTGTFLPTVPTYGTNRNGSWTLEIDDAGAGDTGQLLGWSVCFLTVCSDPVQWSYNNFSVMDLVSDASLPYSLNQMFFVDGTTIYAYPSDFSHNYSWGQQIWQWTEPNGAGVVPSLAVVPLRNSAGEYLFGAADDGWLYKINAHDGATGNWSVSTKRGSCTADSVQVGPAIQLWEKSDLNFRRQFTDDLVFIATADGCGDTTQNRVMALSASDSSSLWIFNGDQSHSMGPGRGMVLDYAHDTLYCVTDSTGSASSVWAINTLNGVLRWSGHYTTNQNESFVPPILANGALYLAQYGGSRVFKINATNGNVIWSHQAYGLNFYDITFDPGRNMLFLAAGETIEAVTDLGASAARAWLFFDINGLGLDSTPTTAPVAAPAFGKLYFGAKDGYVYQVDMGNGEASAAASTGGGSVSMLVPDSADGGVTVNRLMAAAGVNTIRMCIPWNSGDRYCCGSVPTDYFLGLLVVAAPGQIVVGQPATYTLIVTNGGPTNVTEVTVGSVIPDWFNFVSANQGSFFSDEHAVSADLGTLTNGASATLSFTVVPTRGGFAQFKATVAGAAFPENNERLLYVQAVPVASIAVGSVLEGNSGTTPMVFPPSLSALSYDPVSVNYGTFGLTADADVDYVSTYGTLTFNPGETNKTVSVPVIGDTIIEGNEFFLVLLSNPTNAVISTNQSSAVGTIIDDDGPVALHIAQAGDNVLLSWSTNIEGFTLETTYDLDSGLWNQVFSPVGVVGDQNVVTNTVSFIEQFYRLRK
ncbi:MAG TPA: proprotein convertase P-domain-containing protein [Candidatus Binatia bacterium]|nr:proprotein convertase P-domain-containing protein [Candidatus Binatia bacterium]